MLPAPRRQGFTLVEMSVVLVIIGLISGGILVGQWLLQAAGARSVIVQIQNYQAAVAQFDAKYNALPGDMTATTAARYGFATRSGNVWDGDGNGLIEAVQVAWANPGGNMPEFPDNGDAGQGHEETAYFWEDLTSAGLIDQTFTTATGSDTDISQLYKDFPQAKIGQGNYIYVYPSNSANYFGLSAPNNNPATGLTYAIDSGYQLYSAPGLTVTQAYQIDSKMDDGLPLTGIVTAVYLTSYHTGNKQSTQYSSHVTSSPSASPAVAGDCFDSTTAAGAYAFSVSGNNGESCALSFKFLQ